MADPPASPDRPLVSAIVTVYNRAPLVGDAVRSLVRQSLTDLEVIVIDDGSTDGSAEAAEHAGDERVRIIRHERNLGIPAARNSGLEAARGEYVAWLDSDDIARPHRLERQVAFLRAHPEVAMIGSCGGRMTVDGQRKRLHRVDLFSHDDIAPNLLFRSAFQQSSIMGRAEILKAFPYRTDFPVCEDIDVFFRLTRTHRVANMPEVLIDRRLHSGQIVQTESSLIRDRKRILFTEELGRLGIRATDEEIEHHITLGRNRRTPQDRAFLDRSEVWLGRILTANKQSKLFDQAGLELAVARVWVLACKAALTGPNPRHAAARMAYSSLGRGFFNPNGRAWLLQALPMAVGLTQGSSRSRAERKLAIPATREKQSQPIVRRAGEITAVLMLVMLAGWAGRGALHSREARLERASVSAIAHQIAAILTVV